MQWLTENWVWILFAVGIFLLMRRGGMGCGMGMQQHGMHGDSREEGEPHDPVSKRAVDPNKALSSVFRGTVYLFESQETRAQFEQNPEQYARQDTGQHRHHHHG